MAALQEREAALLTVQSIEDDLHKRRAAVAALEEAGPRRCGARQGLPFAKLPTSRYTLSPSAAAATPAFDPSLPGTPMARRVGGDAAKQRKVVQLQNEVASLEAAAGAAKAEYERVKARNLQVGEGRGAGPGCPEGPADWGEPHSQPLPRLSPSPPALPLPPQELERTRQERAAEFGRLARGAAQVNCLYAQRCQEIWRGVADDFGVPPAQHST